MSERESDRGDEKAAILARLKEQGIAEVVVRYDGSCDDGCVEEVDAYDADGGGRALDDPMREMIEEYVYDRLPAGWELDDGAFGEVVFDVGEGAVRFEHSQRYIDITTDEWED